MKNLISMTDFVLERLTKSIKGMTILETFKYGAQIINEIFNYAKFLKKPLELWMFVPRDKNGNIIEEPNIEDYIIEEHTELDGNPKEYDLDGYEICLQNFIEANGKCLFVWQDGFDYKGICEMFSDLEDIIDFEFELTPLADKLLEAGI